MGIPSSGTTQPSSIFRKLNSVFLISSAAFNKASTTEQTEVLTNATGLPVLFVPNFNDLRNRKNIRDRLLAGEDVSRELEFNGIEISDEDRRVFALVKPILEKIQGIELDYPWVDMSKPAPTSYSLGESVIRNSIGYTISVAVAEKVWRKASKFWANEGAKAPDGEYVETHSHGSRCVSIGKNSIQVGCQSCSRGTFEAIARHYNWEPNVG